MSGQVGTAGSSGRDAPSTVSRAGPSVASDGVAEDDANGDADDADAEGDGEGGEDEEEASEDITVP